MANIINDVAIGLATSKYNARQMSSYRGGRGKGTSTFATPGPANDPHFSSVFSLLHFEDNTTDQKGISWTGTPFSYVSGVHGKAAYLNLAGNTLVTPSWPALGTSDWTMEFSFSTDTTGKTCHVFYWARKTTNGLSPIAFVSTENVLYAYSSTGVGWGIFNATPIVTTTPGVFYKIAIVRSGSNFYIFCDGALVASAVNSSTLTYTLSIGPTLGPISGSSTADASVALDEVRVTIGTARYTSAYTPGGPFPDN